MTPLRSDDENESKAMTQLAELLRQAAESGQRANDVIRRMTHLARTGTRQEIDQETSGSALQTCARPSPGNEKNPPSIVSDSSAS
jgi:hypothetical protein